MMFSPFFFSFRIECIHAALKIGLLRCHMRYYYLYPSCIPKCNKTSLFAIMWKKKSSLWEGGWTEKPKPYENWILTWKAHCYCLHSFCSLMSFRIINATDRPTFELFYPASKHYAKRFHLQRLVTMVRDMYITTVSHCIDDNGWQAYYLCLSAQSAVWQSRHRKSRQSSEKWLAERCHNKVQLVWLVAAFLFNGNMQDEPWKSWILFCGPKLHETETFYRCWSDILTQNKGASQFLLKPLPLNLQLLHMLREVLRKVTDWF